MTNKFLPQDEPIHHIPAYISSLYRQFYMNRHCVNWLDADWFAVLSTFGFYARLKKSVLVHIKPKSWTLLVGNSYGWLAKDIASKIGYKGYFEIVDAVPLQAKKVKEKLSPWPHFKSIIGDVETYKSEKKYDTIVCYFLLHELPDKKKKRVINHIASLLSSDGEAILIDYGIACKYHPCKYLLKLYNNIFEPFADSLTTTSLKDIVANDKLDFVSKKFFGGLYQKTIMRKKG